MTEISEITRPTVQVLRGSEKSADAVIQRARIALEPYCQVPISLDQFVNIALV